MTYCEQTFATASLVRASSEYWPAEATGFMFPAFSLFAMNSAVHSFTTLGSGPSVCCTCDVGPVRVEKKHLGQSDSGGHGLHEECGSG